MDVLNEEKIIFIHIPKTAGSAIELLLLKSKKNVYKNKFYGISKFNNHSKAMHHLTAKDLKSILNNYNDFFKFTIIRNPYSKLISEYYWCEVENMGYKSKQSFDKFLDDIEIIVNNNKYEDSIYYDHFMPQYFFVYDENKDIIVDYIGKYEKLNESVQFIKSKFNITSELPIFEKYINRMTNKIILNESQKNRIYNLYKKDFQLFDYKR